MANAVTKAQLKLVGTALIITSLIKMDDYTKVYRAKREALKLRDENKNEKYIIGFSRAATASISDFGITFNDVSPEGYLRATTIFNLDSGADRADFVKKHYLASLSNLSELTEQINVAAKSVDALTTELFTDMEVC